MMPTSGELECFKTALNSTKKTNQEFLISEFILGNIFPQKINGEYTGYFELKNSYDFVGVNRCDEDKHRNKIVRELKKFGFKYSHSQYAYWLKI